MPSRSPKHSGNVAQRDAQAGRVPQEQLSYILRIPPSYFVENHNDVGDLVPAIRLCHDAALVGRLYGIEDFHWTKAKRQEALWSEAHGDTRGTGRRLDKHVLRAGHSAHYRRDLVRL